jgi:deoxyribose-phosphate aldolase
MTVDLRELAREIARDLAQRDRVGESPRGGPPENKGGARPGETSHHSVSVPTISSPPSTNGAPAGVRFVHEQARIADFIDHTLLKPEATGADIDALCDEAREHRFAAVCVNPVWVPRCAQRLQGSGVQLATVIGFPLGANASESKRSEAALAVDRGATELDMVAAIGQIKSGDWNHVADDIAAVVDGGRGTLVKVIIESAALTPVEIIKACAIAKEMRAQYVKTSTGFHSAGGATAESVALMRMVVGDALGVKASGGVRDCDTALRMIANGATRIGTSSGVSMAKCLGAGPLPLRDLLSLASRHSGSCTSGSCDTAAAGFKGTSY